MEGFLLSTHLDLLANSHHVSVEDVEPSSSDLKTKRFSSRVDSAISFEEKFGVPSYKFNLELIEAESGCAPVEFFVVDHFASGGVTDGKSSGFSSAARTFDEHDSSPKVHKLGLADLSIGASEIHSISIGFGGC